MCWGVRCTTLRCPGRVTSGNSYLGTGREMPPAGHLSCGNKPRGRSESSRDRGLTALHLKGLLLYLYPTCSISCELSEGKHGAPTVLESLVPSTGLGKREVISVWYNASYLTTSGPLHLLCLGNSVFSLSRSGLLLSSGSPSKCHLFREAFSGHPTQPKVTFTFSTFTFITTFCVYY